MNLHTPIRGAQLARINARVDEQIAKRSAYISRMARTALDWAARPQDDFSKLAFLDALSFVIDSDLADEITDLKFELGMDADGYPLTDEGDTDLHGDRVFVPAGAL